jgi:hypothetical protein
MEKLQALILRRSAGYQRERDEDEDDNQGLLSRRLSFSDLDSLAFSAPATSSSSSSSGPALSSSSPSGSSGTSSIQSEADIEADPPGSDEERLYTVSTAEAHLIHDVENICGVERSDMEINQMKDLLKVNCLHKGDLDSHIGTRYMVAVDGTAASKRAFDGVMKLVAPNDHVIIVTVRDKLIPRQYGESAIDELQLRFELWKSAKLIVRPFSEALKQSKVDYTILIPDAWDSRKLICHLVKQFKVDYLAIGKHSPAEKNKYHRHFRSMGRYVSHHAKCKVMIF